MEINIATVLKMKKLKLNYTYTLWILETFFYGKYINIWLKLQRNISLYIVTYSLKIEMHSQGV